MNIVKKYIFQFKKEWGGTVVLGIGILILALFLRTYNLLALPIFADEAIYVRWAQIMRNEPTLRFLPLSDGKQPLFMWMVMGILQFFSDPLIAGRIISVLSGVVSLMGIFLLFLRLFGSKKGALLSAFFYAVSPYAVFFDRMALVDSMLAAFGVWTLYFAVLTAQTLRLDMAIFTGFSLGGAWLTKSPAIFFMLMLPSTLAVSSWPNGKNRKVRHVIKLSGLWLTSWLIAFGMYNVLRLGPNFHLVASRNLDYVFTVSEAFKHPLDPFMAHIREEVLWFSILAPGTILLISILGIFFGWRKYKNQIVLLTIWTVFPLLVQAEFAKVFTARYLLFTLPPLFGLAGLAVYSIWRRLQKKIVLLIFTIIVLPSVWIDYLLLVNPAAAPLPRRERSGYLEVWTAGTGIREITRYIKNQTDGSGIVIGTEGSFGTLPDGLQIYLSDLPGVTVIGVGSIMISEVPLSLQEAKEAGNKTYLVVNSTRFGGDPAVLGLNLIKAYPKALQPDGSQESLLFFEVTNRALK